MFLASVPTSAKAFIGNSLRDQQNTEWIDDIGDERAFKMDLSHRNIMEFSLQGPGVLDTALLEITVYDHDFGADEDDLIGKVKVPVKVRPFPLLFLPPSHCLPAGILPSCVI